MVSLNYINCINIGKNVGAYETQNSLPENMLRKCYSFSKDRILKKYPNTNKQKSYILFPKYNIIKIVKQSLYFGEKKKGQK